MFGIDFADLGFILGVAFFGSLHCAGMCGGFVCTYAVPLTQQKSRSIWKYHLSYVSGRIFVYSWIGALMGALGMSLLQFLGPSSSVVNLGAWLAGSVMIIGGVASLFGGVWGKKIGQWLNRFSGALIPSFLKSPKNSQKGFLSTFPLGMISGILPCGMMWAVEMKAMATNSILGGLLTMFLFCLFTSPSLLISGTILSKISPHLRYRSVQYAGLLVIAMGIYTIFFQTHTHH